MDLIIKIFGFIISIPMFLISILMDIGIYFLKLLVLLSEGVLKLILKIKGKQ